MRPPGEQVLRLFIALPVPHRVRTRLDELLAPYRVAHPRARWLEPGSWHLTLLFLGSVPVEHVPAVISLVDEAAIAISPFEVAVFAGGGHVKQGDGVAWLRVTTGAGQIIAAADLVAASCPPGITLAAPPRRTPAAHLTIARRADEGLVASLRDAALGSLEAFWMARHLALYRSHLASSGATYEALHAVPLRGRLSTLRLG